MPEYCPKNGKQCFDNRGDAERAARQFMHREKTRGVMSVYRCDVCKCFHVTSYGYDRSRNIREMNKVRKKK